VAFDAPIANEMSRLTIAEAARRFPGKAVQISRADAPSYGPRQWRRVFAAKGADSSSPGATGNIFAAQMQAPQSCAQRRTMAEARDVGLIEVSRKNHAHRWRAAD